MARSTLAFSSRRASASEEDGGLHGEQGDDLQEVVLHHVREGADPLVEPAPALDAERLAIVICTLSM
jgi:hypothetical protein